MVIRVIVLGLFVTICHGLLSYDSPCDIFPRIRFGSAAVPADYTASYTLQDTCTNGSLYWIYPDPRAYVTVHFPNRNKNNIAVCITDLVGGNLFTITDLTKGDDSTIEGYDYANWVCSPSTKSEDLVLRIDSPSSGVYVAGVNYLVKIS